jgi:hypothetical protein
VQGVAADLDRGHLYYSFTSMLVKTDFAGRVLGTVTGFTGHLGDVTFSPERRRLYGSLEHKEAGAFYVAVFDVDAIGRRGRSAADGDVVRTVHLGEVAADYRAEVRRERGDVPAPGGPGYGCSGIDGISLGPAFGSADAEQLLTVAYGVHGDPTREDNDHQVLLQYGLAGWDDLARPHDSAHRSGPSTPDAKCFVHTGNTRFGVQNLEYDAWSRRWFLGVYPGAKAAFPNYTLFAVDATTPPADGALAGLPGQRGPLLRLADDGLWDPHTGIRGWFQRVDVGLESVGGGHFLLSRASTVRGRQTSDLTLCAWTGNPNRPFEPVPGGPPR